MNDRPPKKTVFRTGLKILVVAGGLFAIQAVLPGRPSEASEISQMQSRIVAPPAFGLSELIAFPNPARLSSSFRYRLNRAATSLSIKIFDMEGRHVRTLAGGVGAGRNDVVWDLTDNRGDGVANGVYQARVTATGADTKTRDNLRVVVQR